MALGTSIQLTEGSGIRVAAGATYTENSQTVRDEKAIIGEPYLATYRISTSTALSVATAADHLLQIMAGSTLNVYIRRIRIWQFGLATTAAIRTFQLFRLTTAGTGGGAATLTALDTTDAAAGATAMTLPTAKGAEGSLCGIASSMFIQTIPTGGPGSAPLLAEWDFNKLLRTKALRIPAGTANGLAVKNISATAAATVVLEVDLMELPW